MFVESPNVEGAVAELAIELAATKLGIPVLKPVAEHGRYDMGFEIGPEILRVQCKWGNLRKEEGVIKVNLCSTWYGPQKSVKRSYTREEIDLLAVYCGGNERCYLLPSELVADRRAIYLRLEPARNGQRACINLASDFEFDGAVAQLARASRWHREGRGFESHQLHSRVSAEETIGADEFRNRMGWYMERASRGERFFVTRRGRPYVRLSGAAPQLRLEESRRERPGPVLGVYGHRYVHAHAA
jgi:prevent-host-death family protein